jgi:hypothetical protein
VSAIISVGSIGDRQPATSAPGDPVMTTSKPSRMADHDFWLIVSQVAVRSQLVKSRDQRNIAA